MAQRGRRVHLMHSATVTLRCLAQHCRIHLKSLSKQSQTKILLFAKGYRGHIMGDLHLSGRQKKDCNIFMTETKGLPFCRDSKA